MTFNRSQLITALLNEYKFLCHDDFDPDVDATPDEYLAMLQSLTDAELVDETSSDDINASAIGIGSRHPWQIPCSR